MTLKDNIKYDKIHCLLRSHIHEDFALNFINKYILGVI